MRIAIPIVAVLLAGCGSAVVERGGSAAPPYNGPLDAGAAVGALECDAEKPYGRGEHDYNDGLARVKDSAAAALDEYMRESGPIFSTPSDGYAVEREQAGRVLFSYDVDGRTKVSMFAADGVRDWNGDDGWGVRAWAQCDPSELPPDVTDDLNIGVWEYESGRRAPVTRVQSFQGSDHCDWTDITFLLVGAESVRTGTCATPAASSPSCCARPTTTWKRFPRAPPTRACAATTGSCGSSRTSRRPTW